MWSNALGERFHIAPGIVERSPTKIFSGSCSGKNNLGKSGIQFIVYAVDYFFLVTSNCIQSSVSLVYPTPNPEGISIITERSNPHQNVLLVDIGLAFLALVKVLLLTGKSIQGYISAPRITPSTTIYQPKLIS